ncbi:hypothetical protein ID866_5359 [Astraeus odoratus]|nr:hypothetical protein ID866_5359 [Astraeus odoratus]
MYVTVNDNFEFTNTIVVQRIEQNLAASPFIEVVIRLHCHVQSHNFVDQTNFSAHVTKYILSP